VRAAPVIARNAGRGASAVTKPHAGRAMRRAFVLMLLVAGSAQAQAAKAPRCDRIATTSIVFGRTGGNMRGSATRIATDGTVTRDAKPSTAARSLSTDVVSGLARLGWSGGFATLRSAPTHPTRNPDEARDYIDLKSACGTKHVETVRESAPAAFRELLALLEALTN
jgi:hypothetical protein